MQQRAEIIKNAIEDVKKQPKKIANMQRPNEKITEINYDKFLETINNIPSKIESASDDDLISCINECMSGISFPELDQSVSSRGLLVAQVHGYELIKTLNHAKTSAKLCGYKDPDIANVDISSTITADDVRDINKKLDEISTYVNQLDDQIKADNQSGVSIGIGVVSIDVGVLLGIVRDTTEDARDYIAANTAVNAKILQDKFAVVNSSAKSLVQVIRDKSNSFGRKVLRLTQKVAKAAAEAYKNSLNLIKKTYDVFNSDIRKDPSFSDDYKHVSDSAIEKSLKYNDEDYEPIAREILINVMRTVRRRAHSHRFNSSEEMSYELFSAHAKPYLCIGIGHPKANYTVQLSAKEREILLHLSPRAMIKELRSIRDGMLHTP